MAPLKLYALALDYDGTIAEHDALDPEARRAIGIARDRGLAVILVTGRILSDLQRVAGDLRFVDAVVAENGAIVFLPHDGRVVVQAPPAHPAFVSELATRGVPADVGQCIVEADAARSIDMLSTIQELRLPLALIFNGGRIMALPQGVTKASGLRAVLRLLGVSEHNTIAIGDAENDHALLAACELGVAVGWGSPALQAEADVVLPGAGVPSVAEYIRGVAGSLTLPPSAGGRHRVSLGNGPEGEPVQLAVRGRDLLIVGDSTTGKSCLGGLVCEQLVLQRYSVCVVDPEGDHRSLAELPGMVALGSASPPRVDEVIPALRHPEVSVILDLSHVGPGERRDYFFELLPELAGLRRRTGLPHAIVIDEAHHLLSGGRLKELLDPGPPGYMLITYRLADLDVAAWPRAGPVLATRITRPEELGALRVLLGDSVGGWVEELSQLPVGEAVLFDGSASVGTGPRRFRVAPRLTTHVRHRIKYLDIPVSPSKAFVFTEDGRPTGQRATTLRELATMIKDASEAALRGHLARGDLSRWVRDVYRDGTLARDLDAIERTARYEALSDVRAGLSRVIVDRYSGLGT